MDQELDCEVQLGPSLACPPKAPTSECLLPSSSVTDFTTIRTEDGQTLPEVYIGGGFLLRVLIDLPYRFWQ